MFINHLNKSITIQVKTNTGTDFRPVYTWSTFDNVDGLINRLSERRVIQNEGGVIMADHILYIDYLSGVNEQHRIYDGENYYRIHEIHNPNGMDRHLEIKMKLIPEGATDVS